MFQINVSMNSYIYLGMYLFHIYCLRNPENYREKTGSAILYFKLWLRKVLWVTNWWFDPEENGEY